MFKSITTYDLYNEAINITGKGIVTIGYLVSDLQITIDGKAAIAYCQSDYRNNGGCYLFGSSLIISKPYYNNIVTVGLFN